MGARVDASFVKAVEERVRACHNEWGLIDPRIILSETILEYGLRQAQCIVEVQVASISDAPLTQMRLWAET